MSPQLRNNDWNVSDLLENVSCLLKVFDCVKELHQDTEKKVRRDVWEASWLSQGSVSLSTQHVLITSVSDRTTTSKPPTLVPLSLSQLGNWWAPCGCVWRPRARKRHMCVCVCVCVAVGVHSGGQSINSAGESVVTCKQGRKVLIQPRTDPRRLLFDVRVYASEAKCVFRTERNS